MPVSTKVKRDLAAERDERLRRLGSAIRTASGSMTQAELGRRLEPFLGEAFPQTTISRWERGAVSMDLEQIRAIELALSVPQGTLFYASGYCLPEVGNRDVELMLRSDPNIHDSLRDDIAVAELQGLGRQRSEAGRTQVVDGCAPSNVQT